MDDGIGYLCISAVILVVSAGLAIIPASMARNKGRSFWGWYVFGFFLFLPALICASVISGPVASSGSGGGSNQVIQANKTDALMKLKQLYDSSILTEEEYRQLAAVINQNDSDFPVPERIQAINDVMNN